jgi:oligopeptide transport system permease protein
VFTYFLKRLSESIPTLLILLTLTFFLLRLAPGGPFDTERSWPPEVQANIAHQYQLDKPIYSQFFSWVRNLASGDLGESFQFTGLPVTTLIAQSLPLSVNLGLMALGFALLVGIPLGCLSAWRPGSFLDQSAVFLCVAGISLPSYLVATLLILLFSVGLEWLPIAMYEGPVSLILPALTLSLRPLALIARLTRTELRETLQSDYVRTARGKGLSESRILLKHALRNSLIPVITLLGPTAASLLTGSFLIEIVFQLPGLGKHFVQAVLNRDYPLVMGVTLVYGVVLIASNLLVDLVYGWVDPRIQLGARK